MIHKRTSGNASCYAEGLEVDDLQSEKARKHDGAQLYAKDKRRMVALTERQAELWKAGLRDCSEGNASLTCLRSRAAHTACVMSSPQGTGVTAYSMHPGWTVTDGVKSSIPGELTAHCVSCLASIVKPAAGRNHRVSDASQIFTRRSAAGCGTSAKAQTRLCGWQQRTQRNYRRVPSIWTENPPQSTCRSLEPATAPQTWTGSGQN